MPYPSRRLFGMPLNKGVLACSTWFHPSLRPSHVSPFIPPLSLPYWLKGGTREGKGRVQKSPSLAVSPVFKRVSSKKGRKGGRFQNQMNQRLISIF